jgi:hypothetical protein
LGADALIAVNNEASGHHCALAAEGELIKN